MSLQAVNITKKYHSGFWGNTIIEAVSNASLELNEGEIFGLVGESGCGKTTISKIMLGLLKPSSGQVIYQNRDITNLNQKQWRILRREIQVVFQHPQMTLHPRRNIYFACAEPIRLYKLANSKDEERKLVYKLIDQVGLTKEHLKKYPHEISGGQAQRLSIVRALSLNPKVLICDEPTSMLDVSVQAQILRLLKDIHKEYGLSILYISHDLEVISAICDRVAVMKQGAIVETGTKESVFSNPVHEYTKLLLSSNINM